MGGYRPRAKPRPGGASRGEVYNYCPGCDRTPNRRLMGWTGDGRYLCRDCREPR